MPWTRDNVGDTLCIMARGVPVNVIDAVVVETRLYPEHERGADLAVLIKGVGSGTEGLVALAEGEGRAVRYGGERDRGRWREIDR